MRMSYEFTLVRAAIEESPQDLWCRSTVSGIKRASQSDTVLPPCGRPAHSPDHEEQPVTVIPTNQPVWPGRPRPLGATWDGEGTNFAVFADEADVRGFTIRHPGIAEHERGTYAGMGSPPVVEHLRRLGVTTVELQPVHHFISEHQVVRRGQTNYWGYNSIGYFAPEARYSSSGRRGQQVREFKAMVRNLHTAGIEVILDVVYNHTAEGGALGPTLSFRGIDNRSYYRLDDANPRAYVDYSGTGNTLNVRHPQVLALIMDSLRYWVLEMPVDGFRFALASARARGFHEVDRLSAFFDRIHQDR